MGKRLSYQKGNHFEWLLAISLAIGLWTYTGYASSVETCRPEPQQVEWVLSGEDNADNEIISYDQFFAPELAHEQVKRSKEYETNVQAVYQSRVEVAMEVILDQSSSYSLPVFHQQAITVLHSCEESSSDISG